VSNGIIDGRRQLAVGSNYAVQQRSGGTGRDDGMSPGIVVGVQASDGVDLSYGMLVSPNDAYEGPPARAVRLPDNTEDMIFGVVNSRGGIADRTSGEVLRMGVHPAVLVMGSVSVGDALYPASTAGYASATRATGQEIPIGYAFESVSTTSNAAIAAEINTAVPGPDLPHRRLRTIQGVLEHTNLVYEAASIESQTGGSAPECGDGNIAAFFSTSGATTSRIDIDLGSARRVGGFRVYATRNTASGEAGVPLVVSWSTDGVTYTEAYRQNVTLVASTQPAQDYASGIIPVIAQYWRFKFSASSGIRWYETELYEASGDTMYARGESSTGSNARIGDTLFRHDQNVHVITASSSNTLRGTIDLRPGTGTSFAVASNTITISAVAPGSASTGSLYAVGGVIDGGGTAIATGLKFWVEAPAAGTIVAARMISDQSGSLVVDVWKSGYSGAPPSSGNSITASAKPTLASAQKYEDVSLVGWTKTVTAGDWFYFNVDSATTITKATISLTISRS
jgi:hypothetical protein